MVGSLRVGLVDDVAGLVVELEGARAGRGLGLDVQDLARAFEIDVLAHRQRLQVGRRGRVVVAAEHAPDARVFRAQPPQRVAGGPVGIGGVHLVERGAGIQHPHVVHVAVVFVEREMRVEAGVVELDLGLGIARRQHGLLKGQVVRLLTFDPIVSVVAERHDRVIGIELRHALLDLLFEPVLRRDAARVAGRPMLVVGHEHEIVRPSREGLVVPAVVVERHGHCDDPVVRRKGRLQFAHERLQVRLRCRRHLFEIDHHALQFVLLDESGDLLDAFAARLCVGKQLGEALAVPDVVLRILQHRQDWHLGLLAMDKVERLAVDVDAERHAIAAERSPRRHDPIEPLEIAPERGVAAVVPIHVEADAQRLRPVRRQ